MPKCLWGHHAERELSRRTVRLTQDRLHPLFALRIRARSRPRMSASSCRPGALTHHLEGPQLGLCGQSQGRARFPLRRDLRLRKMAPLRQTRRFLSLSGSNVAMAVQGRIRTFPPALLRPRNVGKHAGGEVGESWKFVTEHCWKQHNPRTCGRS